MDIVIKNGTVINAGCTFRADVGIRNGRIIALGEDLSGQENIDASGKYVLPGLIETNAYLESPFGNTRSTDNFFKGSQAAAAGGVTTLIDRVMPLPDEDLNEAIRNRRDLADPQVAIDYSLHICLPRLDENSLAEIPGLVDQGYPSFEAMLYDPFAHQALSEASLLRLMNAMQSSNSLLVLHCGSQTLMQHLRQQYPLPAEDAPIPDYPRLWPPAAEAASVLQALSLAAHFETPLFLDGLSTSAALDVLAHHHALPSQVNVSCHLHHLTHSETSYAQKNGRHYACLPPLRSTSDSEALWQALSAGLIQVVASAHRGFTHAQKKLGQDLAAIPPGFANLSALLPVLHDQGVAAKRFSMMHLVALLSSYPAQIFGLHQKGAVAIGKDADLVIFDPAARQTLSCAQMHTGSDFSIYEGEEVHGTVDMTFSRGKIVFDAGRFMGEQGAGHFIPRRL